MAKGKEQPSAFIVERRKDPNGGEVIVFEDNPEGPAISTKVTKLVLKHASTEGAREVLQAIITHLNTQKAEKYAQKK